MVGKSTKPFLFVAPTLATAQEDKPKSGLLPTPSENPEKEIKRVYEYLGLPHFQHDFKNVQQLTKEDDTVYGVYGDHTIRPEIVPLKKDYNDVLGKNASNWIKSNYQWFYDEFKYF